MSRDSTVIIVVTTVDGKLVSIDHNSNIFSKGDPIKPYLDTMISQSGYDLVAVTCFRLFLIGPQRIQYTLVKRRQIKGYESV